MYKKVCSCGTEFMSTGPAGKYCCVCLPIKKEEQRIRDAARSHKYKVDRGMILNPGSGSGSATPKGTAHLLYKHGKYTFETIRYEIKDSVRYCQRCSKDLIDAKQHFWVVHHKDHNHWNHELTNLELLCKQCHQIEHECWKNFTKVQRLEGNLVESSDSKRVGS